MTRRGMQAERRSSVWIWWVLGGLAVLLCVIFLVVAAFFFTAFVALDQSGDEFLSPMSEELDVPPSRRGQGARPSSELIPGPGLEGMAHEELRCAFTGEARLDPGLRNDRQGLSSSQQRMTLLPGASFKCERNGEFASGHVDMDATFESLDLLAGVAEGPGLIRWRTVPADEAEGHPAPLESATSNEVELRFPEILVWITITEGPYEGFRGKLVLDRWELVEDGAGNIVGVAFQPTDFRMSTV